MLEYIALDTMYFIVIKLTLIFFYKAYQKLDGILRGSLVKYVTVKATLFIASILIYNDFNTNELSKITILVSIAIYRYFSIKRDDNY